jgi:hypothetical protein
MYLLLCFEIKPKAKNRWVAFVIAEGVLCLSASQKKIKMVILPSCFMVFGKTRLESSLCFSGKEASYSDLCFLSAKRHSAPKEKKLQLPCLDILLVAPLR